MWEWLQKAWQSAHSTGPGFLSRKISLTVGGRGQAVHKQRPGGDLRLGLLRVTTDVGGERETVVSSVSPYIWRLQKTGLRFWQPEKITACCCVCLVRRRAKLPGSVLLCLSSVCNGCAFSFSNNEYLIVSSFESRAKLQYNTQSSGLLGLYFCVMHH